MTPRPLAPVVLGAGAGVSNLGVALDETVGFSTNDVSVVLRGESRFS